MASANPPIDKVRALQRALYVAAKQLRQRRFHVLYDRIARPDVLQRAWEQVRGNKGAAGIDGETLEAIETFGAGPGGADRGQAGAGADLRSQLPAVFIWIQAQAGGLPRIGGHSQGSECRGAVGGGRRFRRLLRKPGPRLPLEVSGPAGE